MASVGLHSLSTKLSVSSFMLARSLSSRPSLLMFVAREGGGDERGEGGTRPPVALPGLTHCTVATPLLLVLLAGKYLGQKSEEWRERERERGEAITHPTFLCSMLPCLYVVKEQAPKNFSHSNINRCYN